MTIACIVSRFYFSDEAKKLSYSINMKDWEQVESDMKDILDSFIKHMNKQ